MTDVLYVARGQSLTTSDLYTIDPVTAVATSIGATGFALTGLAVDSTNGTLYGATSSNSSAHPKSLIAINTNTGSGTFIGAFNTGSSSTTMSDICCSSSGQLYGWASDAGQLFSINKSTGQVTLIGSNDLSFGGALDFSGTTLYHIGNKVLLGGYGYNSGFVNNNWGDASARTAVGTQFAPLPFTVRVGRVTFPLSKTGSPADNVVAAIYTNVASAPGTLVWSHTISAASIPATFNIDIAAPGLSLAAGTYWFVLTRSGAIDPANYYSFERQGDGTTGAYYNGATWGAPGSIPDGAGGRGPTVKLYDIGSSATVNTSNASVSVVNYLNGFDWSSSNVNLGAGSIGSDGLMWGVAATSSSSPIVTVDLGTATTTHVGDSALTRIDALAWSLSASPPATIPTPQGLCVAFTPRPLDTVSAWTRIDA